MKFIFDIVYWTITAIVMGLLLFYVPRFAITVICVVLVLAVVMGILRYKYEQWKRKK